MTRNRRPRNRKRSRNRSQRQPDREHIALPETFAFNVQVPAPATPEHLPVQLILHAHQRNDYYSKIRFVDAAGQVRFQQSDLDQELEELQKIFPIDHYHYKGNLNQKITLALLGSKDIDWAVAAYELHKDKIKFPPDYEKKLDAAKSKLEKLEVDSIQIDVVGDTGDYEVAIRNDHSWEPTPTYEEETYLFATEGKKPPAPV